MAKATHLLGNALIRPSRPQDYGQWRALWEAYTAFYSASVPDDATEATWRRILGGGSAIGALMAEQREGGALLGFIHYVIHPRTWHARDSCYLEDLYVDSPARGLGIGRQLCGALKALCMEKGLSQLYWHTQEHNRQARGLYDQIATKDDFVRYVMKLHA